MKRRIRWFTYLIALMLMLAACNSPGNKISTDGPATGDDYEAVTIRLAYAMPQDHHVAKGIDQFAKDVTEKSGGKVNIQVYPAGQLLSDKDMNQSLLSGGVEMVLNSSTLWSSTVPAMGIFDVPFVLKDYEEIEEALNGEFGDKLKEAMEEKGAKVLMFADYGYVQFANNKHPLKMPSDFKGLKIRSFGDLPSEVIQAYGASPVFLGGGEVYMGLQRKTVDGATSGTTAMLQRKYHEVTDYLTVVNYAAIEFPLVINQDFWDGLPEKTQGLIQETATEAEQWIREQAEAEDQRTAKELEDLGMEVNYVSEEDLPQWIEAAKPVHEVFLKNAGNLGKELLEMVNEK